jgi:hypothetical protein
MKANITEISRISRPITHTAIRIVRNPFDSMGILALLGLYTINSKRAQSPPLVMGDVRTTLEKSFSGCPRPDTG